MRVNSRGETELEHFTKRIRIDLNSERFCWVWTGGVGGSGYGAMNFRDWESKDRYMGPAHIWAYNHYVGPVPEGLQIDHQCRNRLCCNPAHLEPVTPKENMRRVFQHKKTCAQGHPWIPENIWKHKGGGNYCKICSKERHKEWLRVRREHKQ